MRIIVISIKFQFVISTMLLFFKIGIRIAISTSKIMNSNAIIMNWVEMMLFLSDWELNPHSKLEDASVWEIFSSFRVRLIIFRVKINITDIIIIINKKIG